MPIQDCQLDGRKGKRWGKSGKCYTGPGARRKALRQARAIKASQVSNREQVDGQIRARCDSSSVSRGCSGTSDLSTGLPDILKVNRTQIVPSNPLKADPTRTATLRRKFETAIWIRFARLRRKIVDLVAVEDAFGLRNRVQSPFEVNTLESPSPLKRARGVQNYGGKQEPYESPYAGENPASLTFNIKEQNDGQCGCSDQGEMGRRDESNTTKGISKGMDNGGGDSDNRVSNGVGDSQVPVLNQRWAFRSDAEKLRLFQEWLQAESQLEILAGAQAATDEAYWQAFVEEGYRKGAGRAFNDTRKAALASGVAEEALFEGTRLEFLRSSFARPVAIGKVKLLAGRVFTDLKGVTEVMNTKMTRILAEGLAQGQNPAEMARTMIKDGMGFTKTRGIQSRAMTIARTEIIRAHAEGQLDAMEDLGVTEVGVMVEWSTAGDDRVCPLCAPMDGVVLKIPEARGLLPRHPNCIVGESVVECDDAISILKAKYTGEIIKLVTAKGRRLSVTPNHILLTEYGFLPARFAYEGLKILEAPVFNADSVVAPDDHTNKSSIADIFATFSKYPAVFSKGVPLAPEYLHGDGSFCDSEVDIVCPDSELWDEESFQGGMRSIIENRFQAFQFLGAKAILSTSSSVTQFLKGVANASDSSMGRFRELLALILGRLLHAKVHRVTSTAGMDSSIYESFVNRAATDLKSFGESLDAHPTLKQFYDLSLRDIKYIALGFSSNVLSSFDIDARFLQTTTDTVVSDLESLGQLRGCLPVMLSLDKVVSIDVVHISDLPVYDVETSSTLYRVNGLVTSNCRCAHIPSNVGESTKGQIRGKVKIQEARDESVRAELPGGRDIKGEGLRFQDPETGRYTMKTSKRTLAQQKNRSPWAGADRTVAKVRPKARVSPREVKPVAPPKPKPKVSKVRPKARVKPQK